MSRAFEVGFWALYMAAAMLLLALLVQAFGADWLRRARAARAWLRLRVLRRWRRSSLGAMWHARRVMAEVDVDDWAFQLVVEDWAMREEDER